MPEKQDLPSEEEQRITDAPYPYRNCTVCGLWLDPGETHDHEKENS